MIRPQMMSAAAGVLLCAAGLAAQTSNVLGPEAAAHLQLAPGSADYARIETVAVTGQPFSKAIRIQVTKAPARAQEVRVTLPVDAAFNTGDVLMLTFWARGIESAEPSGEISVDARFQAVKMVPRATTLSLPADAGRAWKKIQYPFALVRNGYGKGEAELAFVVGHRAQTVEIGGIELINYQQTKRASELPMTTLGYKGMEANAVWRAAAKRRIEEVRKAELTVSVKDKAGKPVRNAVVAVHMRRHAFGFGTAVSGPALSGKRLSPENLQKYKDGILQLFNKAVMENDLKWPQWSVEQDRPATLVAVDWLRQNGIAVRGHNLVWPSWRNSPKAAADLKDNPAALAKFTLDHIRQEAGALEGRLVEWDVINEPFSNHDIMDVLGRQVMVDWFKAARSADPKAKLYINDFDILSGNVTEHQNHYFDTIKFLLDQGAPVEGIGLQSHFPARVTPPEEVLKRLDRFASFKKDLEVTEFDIDTSDEVTQAAYTRDFLIATFSHPSITGFMMWGYWEGSHWRPRGAMIRADWSPKPNLQAYKDLVFKEWWTDVSGKTGKQGTYAVRGFLGDYEIEVRAGGKTKTVKAVLPKGGTAVDCVIE